MPEIAIAALVACNVGMLAYVFGGVARGLRRASPLARSITCGDHGDWWSSVSKGDLVGGGPCATFALVACHGGNVPMYVCAFDTEMVILINCRSMEAEGWMKAHANVRSGRRGFAEVVEINGSRVAVWRPRLAEVVEAFRSAGWHVDPF